MNVAPLNRPARAVMEVTAETPLKPGPTGPSMLYRGATWAACVQASRLIPAKPLRGVAKAFAALYRTACPARREIVFQNLLPLLGGDRAGAAAATRELFSNFATKLVDLWRYESGGCIEGLFGELEGWQHFEQAHARGRGVLLVTLHLGNWEFGAPVLTRRGIRLQVITQAEPDSRLTANRQAARARRGIDTLPLGDDPFAAVEIIRRLEAGDAVALLMDRPPTATATPAKLFGRPFAASVSAAELARATGCALLPVYIPRGPNGYRVQTLPEIPYERAALRERAARLELTQRILTAFEPGLRAYASQWYHFVPIWPPFNGDSHAHTGP